MSEQAKVPNLTGLTELAKRDSVGIKPTLLRVMTDLYTQKPVHTEEEEQQYIELALRLVNQVDAGTRAIVANRLAGYPAAPRAVLERVQPRSVPHSEIEPQSTPAAPSVATLAELSELFLTADAEARRMILLHLDYAELPAAEPVAPQLVQDTIWRLEMAALTHNMEGFAQDIERALQIDRTLARRLIEDQSGEPILVVAHALAMPADVLQRILLCLNPAVSHSVLRVYELSKLYEEMDTQSAARLIALWQTVHRPAQRAAAAPRHQPQHYDDDRHDDALPARPAIRWEEHAQRNTGT